MRGTEPLDEARWARLNELFEAAIALPPDLRAEFVASAGDALVESELRRLVAAHERAERFLETPALSGAWPAGEGEREESAVGRVVGSYRLLEEIGRGGMGVVHRAERADGQYESRVAVKLIKRGMDTDLVLRRFRTERQILASLEHPNIARLLDGGMTADGRPYFVMEYIAGEPIDRNARGRRLTVPERLRLFLRVCDAVAYAHAHRIVHRDIKPANVLVTAEGVPKLLDFGIARTLEPGPMEPTVSVTGLRMLTPEYASPEQVEGRPASTASDVYSLGVVLYELLTGHSPYSSGDATPAATAERVRTLTPPRPSEAVRRGAAGAEPARPRLRKRRKGGDVVPADVIRQLRGDLDTIVLAALQKEPERRYGSAEALAADIRNHLAGDPIRARPDTLAYRAGRFVRRNRAAVLSAAATALVVAAGTATVRLVTGADDTPSLVASGVLAPRDRILVADFTDHAGDAGLATAVTDALRTDLSQSAVVQVLTPPQVRAALARMRHSPDALVDDSLAREVAVREGARAVVTGGVARLGGRYTITVQLLGAETGETLVAARETASDSTELVAAVDRASRALRRRIGETLRQVRQTASLEQVTTPLLPALRAYTAGYRRFVAGDRTGALPLLERAVALDTGFATAHRALASLHEAMAEPGRSREALERAIAHADRIPFLERQFLVAGYAYAGGDYDSAIATYHRVLERYPTDVPALNNLALAHRALRRFAVAESLWHRAIALDSSIAVLYYGLHSVQAFQGRFDASARTLATVGRRFPDDGVLPVVRVQDAAARQDWPEAERLARANVAAWEGDALRLVDARETLAGILMTRGRLPEAERLLRGQLALTTETGSWSRYFLAVQQLAAMELRFRNRPDRARTLLDSVLARHPLESLQPADRPEDMLARLYIEIGDVARGRELLAATDLLEVNPPPLRRPERDWTLGLLALAEGRAENARRHLQHAADAHDCTICVLPDLARAHEAAGAVEAAAAVYEQYLSTPWLWRYTPDARELGRVLIRLGELYERAGEHARAARAREHLVHLWDGAEAEAARERQRIARHLAGFDAAAAR